MGFSSEYSNGGQNATYTADGGGGGGLSLNGQMEGMSNFDPASWINILREDQRNIANNRMFNELAMMQRRRAYDEKMANDQRLQEGADRQRANAERARAEQAALMAERNAPTDALRPYNAALNYADRMTGPLDGLGVGWGGQVSKFRNAPFAADLAGVKLANNPWEEVYKIAAGSTDPTAQSQANKNNAEAAAINSYSSRNGGR